MHGLAWLRAVSNFICPGLLMRKKVSDWRDCILVARFLCNEFCRGDAMHRPAGGKNAAPAAEIDCGSATGSPVTVIPNVVTGKSGRRHFPGGKCRSNWCLASLLRFLFGFIASPVLVCNTVWVTLAVLGKSGEFSRLPMRRRDAFSSSASPAVHWHE